MKQVYLITPPDIVRNHNFSLLLVHPSKQMREDLTAIVEPYNISMNLYMYDEELPRYDWLLNIAKMSDIVVIDIDNCPPETREIVPYLLGQSNLYWLTQGENLVYNTLSTNRIYSLEWITQHLGDETVHE